MAGGDSINKKVKSLKSLVLHLSQCEHLFSASNFLDFLKNFLFFCFLGAFCWCLQMHPVVCLECWHLRRITIIFLGLWLPVGFSQWGTPTGYQKKGGEWGQSICSLSSFPAGHHRLSVCWMKTTVPYASTPTLTNYSFLLLVHAEIFSRALHVILKPPHLILWFYFYTK